MVAEKLYIGDDQGTKGAVAVPLEEYERPLEDRHDLAIVAERCDEPC